MSENAHLVIKDLVVAPSSDPSKHILQGISLTVKPGEWRRLRVEWKGDQMAARLDGKELRAQHAFLATAKARSWLAATQTVQVRNLKISGESAAEKP